MSGKITSFRRFFPFLAVFILFSNMPARAGQGFSTKIHEPVIAGTWYPGTSSELKKQVEEYLGNVPSRESKGHTIAIVCPHAGYIYSGQVAAHSYKAIQGEKFDSVIVIGPSHQFPFRGVATYDCAGFRTPLGVIPLDRELITALTRREPRIRDLPDAFRQEHSLEIQLPFLQVLLPDSKLVPLMMGDPDPATCRWLADAIVESVKGKSVLIVASSDLSHFHSYDVAVEMDQRLLQKIRAMDVNAAEECLEVHKCEACGQGPIITAIIAAGKLGADRCDILYYANSGDVTGEKISPRGVVGYGAARFSGPFPSNRDRDRLESKKKAGIDLGLTSEERAELHMIARKAIEAGCSGKPAPKTDTTFHKLLEPSGAFVTIYKNGELRGCIGQIVARMPLVEAVAAMAQEAAFRDTRFTPLRSDELSDLKIEISVLTPLQKISSADEIEVGKHGIVIVRDGSMGLLLPQVATEYGWDKTEFLENSCRKAGLPKNTWKEKETEIYVFSADVF